MIDIRPFASLGHARFDWLDTRHHFSFAGYRDAARMNWGALRVWNDDIIAPGTGFDPHGHKDMEIITYVLEGAITHRDSLGNEGRTEAGDVQVMSAGTGIQHAEYNREAVPTHIFQIWIIPAMGGGAPTWSSARFPKADRAGELVTLASGRPGDEGALPIRQDAAIKGATLLAGKSLTYRPATGRHVYVVPARGDLAINGKPLARRAGAAIKDLAEIEVTAVADAELLLTDVPAYSL